MKGLGFHLCFSGRVSLLRDKNLLSFIRSKPSVTTTALPPPQHSRKPQHNTWSLCALCSAVGTTVQTCCCRCSLCDEEQKACHQNHDPTAQGGVGGHRDRSLGALTQFQVIFLLVTVSPGVHRKCHLPLNFCLGFQSPFDLSQDPNCCHPAVRTQVQPTRTKLPLTDQRHEQETNLTLAYVSSSSAAIHTMSAKVGTGGTSFK